MAKRHPFGYDEVETLEDPRIILLSRGEVVQKLTIALAHVWGFRVCEGIWLNYVLSSQEGDFCHVSPPPDHAGTLGFGL